ncbi:hypothetical protein F4808DRAFT_442217 [Astrocystis sublimbata]|nr:hypothetical protein F4808DRAFT_442217 [Astrocystis sublimbata]
MSRAPRGPQASRLHHTNDKRYRPTPTLDEARQPSEGELGCYQTGPQRHPNLGRCGSFRVWELRQTEQDEKEGKVFPDIVINNDNFNCIAWSVGHTDRWLQPGREMNDTYTLYRFVQCGPDEAEVDVYRIEDAPLTRLNASGELKPNPQSLIKHAHRRDYPQFDSSPHHGCSSKLGFGSFVAHNRSALEDNRSWNSRYPPVGFGTIYQHWKRSPEHFSFPGKEHNAVEWTGHFPDDPVFELGYGENPPGHQDNLKGVPRSLTANNNSNHHAKRNTSLPEYAKVSRMRPYDPIPPARRDARVWAQQIYDALFQWSPGRVKTFNDRFHAWTRSWKLSISPSESE